MQHIVRPYILAKIEGKLFLGENRCDLTVTKNEWSNVSNLQHQFHPFFSRKLKGHLFSGGSQSDFIVTKMSDQWQEFRCTCTGEEVGQNKVISVDLGDLLKIWTENIAF